MPRRRRLRFALFRIRLLAVVAGGLVALAALVFAALPRPQAPGTALVLLASASGDSLAPVRLGLGGHLLTLAGPAPRAPDSRAAARLSLAPGDYPVTVAGVAIPATVAVRPDQVEPVLLAVAGGRVAEGGVYAGDENVNLGLGELAGRLTPLADFHLVDQAGRALDRGALLGSDTVIAAFHTTCRETCPLYTGLMFQLRRSAPGVRLVEVTTDPGTDTPAALAAYRARIGADWTLATGTPEDVAAFWGPLGVPLASGDTHTSALVLVDRHGFVRAAYTGVPDVGGRLPGALAAQLDAAGRQLLAGHGEGWGAPQVVDSLRTISGAAADTPATAGGPAPTFTLRTLDGRRVSLEEVRDRPVILNFWYAGCPPCQEEMPLLQAFADQHPGVALLLIDHRDGAATARAFAAARHIRAPVLLDDDGSVTAAYRVVGFPTSVFLRPDGSEASRVPHAVTHEELAAHVFNLGAPGAG